MNVKKRPFVLFQLVVVVALCSVMAWRHFGHDRVADIVGFTDGGTLVITLVDWRGHKESVSFDYQIGTATPGRLYIGAKLVPLGSKKEKEIITILQRHLNHQLSPGQQRALAVLPIQDVTAQRDEKTYYQYRLIKAIEKLKALEAGQQSEA